MAYDFYMGPLLLPVPPEALTVRVNGRNSTMTLLNDGEVSVLKEPGLKEIRFSALLPNVRYPFAKYTAGFAPAETYLAFFERVMKEKEPFQFIVSRCLPTGALLFDTNVKVTLENLTLREAAGETGFDVRAEIELRQFRPWGTKTFSVETPLPSAPVAVSETRPPSTASSAASGKASGGKAYKVQIPGMAVLTVQAGSVAEAIRKGCGTSWKGTVYVDGVAYDAQTGKKIESKTEAPSAAQVLAKAEAATGKTSTAAKSGGAKGNAAKAFMQN